MFQGTRILNLGPSFLKFPRFPSKTLQYFPAHYPFSHGAAESPIKIRFFASMVDPRTQSMATHFTTPCVFISLLRHSAASRSLRVGQMTHSCILRSGFESHLLVANILLNMYFVCGSISSALQLFYEMPFKDVVSWNTVFSGLVGSGLFEQRFGFFRDMKRTGVRPSQSTFASMLAKRDENGIFLCYQQIHGESLKLGFCSDCCVGNALLTAYVNCGYVTEGRKIFDGMGNFDEISFEILLMGYLQEGKCNEAFELFKYSCLVDVSVTDYVFTGLVSLCASLASVRQGIQIHGYIVKIGLDLGISVVNSLVTMYARSFQLEDSERLFCWLSENDIVTWSSIIGGYAFNGLGDLGVGHVARFLSSGLRMNESTFSSFLSCAANVFVLETAKRVHGLILKLRETVDQGTDNIILTMYSRCKSLSPAKTVFKSMKERDAVSFNILIGLFRECDLHEEPIKLFCRAQFEGFTEVDEIMFSSILSSCAKLVSLEIGEQIHSCIVKLGFERVFPLGNSLLELYSQCGEVKEMERSFKELNDPNTFSWNMMMMGYAYHRLIEEPIRIWHEMKALGIEFNEFSYSVMINLCDHVETLTSGKQIQARIYKLGQEFDTPLMNSLLSMYANCGIMEEASVVFKDIRTIDDVSWNAMVSGYSQNGLAEESIKFYLLMTHSGLRPNEVTFVSMSKSCAMLAELALGSQFHGQVIIRGFESDVTVANSFITMYAKCGNIGDSAKIFQNTFYRNMITWNSIICGYANHGFGREALNIFTEMKFLGFKPNDVTFIGVLSACCHAGLVQEAWDHFNSMYVDHNVVPYEEHYTCMVDILCRAGELKEATKLIEKMPFQPCSSIWKTVLRACVENGDVNLGEVAAKRILQSDPQDSAAYVLLSNVYASVEKRDNRAEMRRMMKVRGVKKEVGCSWIWS